MASLGFASPVSAWTIVSGTPNAMAYDAVNDRVFVASTGTGLTVVDGATGTLTATFGVHGGAYGATGVQVIGDHAYVTSFLGISPNFATEVYDTATLELVATVPCALSVAAAAGVVWMVPNTLQFGCGTSLIRFDPATLTTSTVANTFSARRLLSNPTRPDELLQTNGTTSQRVDMDADPATALATASIDISSLTPAPSGATLYGLDGSGNLMQYDALTFASLGVVSGSPTGISKFAVTGGGGGKLAYSLSASPSHVRVAALAAPGTQLSDDQMFPSSAASQLAWNATGTRLYAAGSVFNILPRASSHMAGGYHALSPQRILDTRDGTGAPSATPLARAPLDLQVTGRGGLPASDVLAVVVNVTATNGSPSSRFLTAYPTGSVVPFTSNVNYEPGRTVANAVTVPVGAGGRISIVNDYGVAPNAQTVDVIVDVVGYYDNGVARGGHFNPVTPARVLDTRNAIGVTTSTPVTGEQQIDLQVTGRGGVPSNNVSAVVLNLTATDGDAAGYATAWPQGQTRPGTSNVNWPAGTTVANLVTVGVGATGQVSLSNRTGNVAFVADVVGWYDASGTTGAVFWPTTPNREYDTRTKYDSSEPLDPGESRTMRPGTSAPYSTVVGVIAQLTASNGTQAGYLTTSAPGAAVPVTSSVNWAPGKNASNLAISGTTDDFGPTFAITNGSPGPVDLIVDVYGFFVTPDN